MMELWTRNTSPEQPQRNPMTTNDTHSKLIGYILWIFGFTGSHRFYYGKPITGTIWFFTLGLLGIGWIIDLFLIPGMDRAADRKYTTGDRKSTRLNSSHSQISN